VAVWNSVELVLVIVIVIVVIIIIIIIIQAEVFPGLMKGALCCRDTIIGILAG
jgi:hypothetical protein